VALSLQGADSHSWFTQLDRVGEGFMVRGTQSPSFQ
jgi:hypothetical protein